MNLLYFFTVCRLQQDSILLPHCHCTVTFGHLRPVFAYVDSLNSPSLQQFVFGIFEVAPFVVACDRCKMADEFVFWFRLANVFSIATFFGVAVWVGLISGKLDALIM